MMFSPRGMVGCCGQSEQCDLTLGLRSYSILTLNLDQSLGAGQITATIRHESRVLPGLILAAALSGLAVSIRWTGLALAPVMM
jgi:hypothetical protein